jgi:hypothetical protein
MTVTSMFRNTVKSDNLFSHLQLVACCRIQRMQ